MFDIKKLKKLGFHRLKSNQYKCKINAKYSFQEM